VLSLMLHSPQGSVKENTGNLTGNLTGRSARSAQKPVSSPRTGVPPQMSTASA
jgi:hypothetical protein